MAMANMRQIVIGMHNFVSDHKDQWPDSLQALVESGKYIPKQMLQNPRLPGLEVGYVYIKPAQPPAKSDPQQLILYEAHDEFGEGVSCVFVDGHVEFIADPNRFTALLHAARGEKPAETQPANPQ
jgi:prepilin-type processing-associated H-X9-DG protein